MMKLMFQLSAAFQLAACLLSCSKAKPISTVTKLTGHKVNGWPDKPYDRVVGYLFDNPTDEPFSLLRTEPVDMNQLLKLKTKEVILDENNVDSLLNAVFNSNLRFGLTACYNPHHVFVFFKDTQPIAAIEICFSCDNIAFYPTRETDFHFDLEALARLSDRLGLGLGPTKRSVDDYVGHIHDRLKEDAQ